MKHGVSGSKFFYKFVVTIDITTEGYYNIVVTKDITTDKINLGGNSL